MRLDDRSGRNLDPRWEGVVVVFNASATATAQRVPALAGAHYRLHPVQAGGAEPGGETGAHYLLHPVQGGGADPGVKTSSCDRSSGTFTVPSRTVAVFVTG